MKFNHVFTALLLLMAVSAFSQSKLPGINYQAVARDEKGQVLANKDISLRISLRTGEAGGKSDYTETHRIRTNELGLFNLVVGEGKVVAGDFLQIPWSSMNIWMELAIDENGGENFSTISSSQLMAVPYAFHAATADEIKGEEGLEKAAGPYWKTNGNDQIFPGMFFGSLDCSDLVFKTNNIERMRIYCNGEISLSANFNTDGVMHFTNTTQSYTKDDGAVIVEGGVGIEKNLNVGGNTEVDGTLGVDGETTLRNNLVVVKNDPGFVATIQNNNDVEGDGLLIKLGDAQTPFSPPTSPPQLSPELVTKLKNLIRSDYNGNKLTLLGEILSEGALDELKTVAGLAVGTGNMIIDFINDQLNLPLDIGLEINGGLNLPFNMTAPINSGLNLPYKIGPYGTPSTHIWDETTIFGGLDLGALGTIPKLKVPELNIPAMPVIPQVTVMPTLPAVVIPGIPANALKLPFIPQINLTSIGIEAINPGSLEFWGIPNFTLSDAAGTTPLDNKNEFIRFADKNDKKMGSIRAVSVSDWAANYLNPIFLYSLYSAFTSSKVDKFHSKWHFEYEIAGALKNYAKLGVEYSSGNGDYAEWLERIDTKELISAGDIVGVVGGKITKNLEHAEQVMAVSHNPIVLGNIPAEGKTPMGNNVAFMGQIPVKVVGPVATGDYIIGQSNTPGYGIAKHESDMTIDDFKYAVGRSWENNQAKGPKMVNTVVGVHNGDFIKILKKHEAKFQESESRFQSLEAKVDMLMKTQPADAGIR